MLKNRKGQSTVEYILLVTAVLVVIIFFVGPTGVFRGKLNSTLDEVTNGMANMGSRIAGSRPLSP